MIRIGRATGHTNEARGFHAPGTTGPFGAAVACGHAARARRRQDDQRARHRRLARRRPAGIRQGRWRHGEAAASRARLGGRRPGGEPRRRRVRPAPRTVIEGEFGFLRVFCTECDESHLTHGLGQRFRDAERGLEALSGATRPRIAAVRAVRDLQAAHGFTGGDVAAITVTGTPRMVERHNILEPADLMLAQYSIPFCVALALFREARDPESYDERALADPAIRALTRRVRLVPEAGGGHGAMGSTSRHADRRPAVRAARRQRHARSRRAARQIHPADPQAMLGERRAGALRATAAPREGSRRSTGSACPAGAPAPVAARRRDGDRARRLLDGGRSGGPRSDGSPAATAFLVSAHAASSLIATAGKNGSRRGAPRGHWQHHARYIEPVRGSTEENGDVRS